MGESILFAVPEVLGEISFEKAGITYIPSDMGPDNSRLPDPVLLRPALGIWMVDPGPDLRSWRLLRFIMEGSKLFDVSLVPLLGLSEPRLMVPWSIAADGDSNLFLVASRKFDFDSGSGEDFVLVKITAQGKLDYIFSLPDYDATTFLLVNENGTVFSRMLKEEKYVWNRIDPNGKLQGAGLSPVGSVPVAAGDHLLERIDGWTFRVVGENDIILKVEGEPSAGQMPVHGDANIFGFVRGVPFAPDPAANGGYVQAREVEVLKLDLSNRRIVNLGRHALPPNRSYGSATKPFVLHSQGQGRFDPEGNLFDIAWQADSLRVYVLKTGRRR